MVSHLLFLSLLELESGFSFECTVLPVLMVSSLVASPFVCPFLFYFFKHYLPILLHTFQKCLQFLREAFQFYMWPFFVVHKEGNWLVLSGVGVEKI